MSALKPATIPHLEEVIQRQTAIDDNYLTVDGRLESTTMFFLLGSLVQGRALRILQGIPSRSGFEAWRQLHR